MGDDPSNGPPVARPTAACQNGGMVHLPLFLVMLAADETPDADDVVAGPWGALLFVLLIGAVAFLCWSFVKQLRKAREARDAGVYGDEPRGPEEREPTDHSPEA